MASSTIDLLLKTKADTSGIAQVKSAIQSTNQELVLMGNSAGSGAKGLKNVDTAGKKASGSLAVLSTSLTLFGNTLGGKVGQDIAKCGTRMSQLKSAFDAVKALLPSVTTLFKGVGGAAAGAYGIIAAEVVGIGVLLKKLYDADRLANKMASALKTTYKGGYVPYASVEQHEGYQRRLDKLANFDKEAATFARIQKSIQDMGIQTNNRNESSDRYDKFVLTRQNEYQEKIDATDMAIAHERDERKKLVLERQRVELQAEWEIRRAKDALNATDDAREQEKGKLEVAHLERNLALEQVRTSEVLKRFDDEKIKRDEERVRIANEAAEREANLAKETLRQKELAIEKERRANEIKKTTTEQILSLEKEIANTKEQADNWDRNADAARGQNFGDWSRGQRDNERANRDAKNQRDKNINRAKSEYDRLRSMNPKAMSKWHKERLGQLSEYLGYQSGNNPHLKTLEEKEQERDNLQKSMDEHLKNLDEAISGNVALKG